MSPTIRWATIAVCGLLFSTAVGAQGFSALVSPPRFEDRAKPGTTYRNVIEISNISAARARFVLQTADWQLDPSGSAVFSNSLAANSCRPWVGIEAPEITIGANAKRRYRFEVAVPADAPAGECRFAILIEGDPEAAKGAVAVPVAGRLGVIVYLGIGDAKAQLEVLGQSVQTVGDRALPVLSVRNRGNAHGRVEGVIDGTDASGRRLAFVPANGPILPGETRPVVLHPQADDATAAAPAVSYPLRLTGRLDWGSQRIDIDTTVAP